MGLTLPFVEEHIDHWTSKLKSEYRPYREKWPSYLFHHAPLENALRIIRDGNLRSRSDPENSREIDIAAEGVISNRSHAHDQVRLYFRPRTPTQYHIEGIRKSGECKWECSHAPVLVMFVFDAKRVLTLDGTKFCDRNMQSSEATIGHSEEYFMLIPFEKVYHEGGIAGDTSIISHRCAEVLCTSPLPLEGNLKWIYCRSEAERLTLIHQLGLFIGHWKKRILVSEDLKVFDKNYTFVDDVKLGEGGLGFALHPRYDRRNVSIAIQVRKLNGPIVIDYANDDFPATPQYPNKKWVVKKQLAHGHYHVQFQLEGHLAFESIFDVAPELV